MHDRICGNNERGPCWRLVDACMFCCALNCCAPSSREVLFLTSHRGLLYERTSKAQYIVRSISYKLAYVVLRKYFQQSVISPAEKKMSRCALNTAPPLRVQYIVSCVFVMAYCCLLIVYLVPDTWYITITNINTRSNTTIQRLG